MISDFATDHKGESIDLTAFTGLRDFADLVADHLSEGGGNAVLRLDPDAGRCGSGKPDGG